MDSHEPIEPPRSPEMPEREPVTPERACRLPVGSNPEALPRSSGVGPRAAALVGLALTVLVSAALLGQTHETLKAARATGGGPNTRPQARGTGGFRLATPLELTHPEVHPDANSRLREDVDRAALSLGTQFSDRPLAEASLRLTLWKVYLALDEPKRAEAQVRRAVELYCDHPEPERLRPIAAPKLPVEAPPPLDLRPKDTPLLRRIAEIVNRVLGPDHPDTVDFLHHLTGVYLEPARQAVSETP